MASGEDTVHCKQLRLPDLLDAIDSVSDWFLLGVYLQVAQNKLQEIEKQHNKDASRCKVEMLSLWLQGECTPSWKLLADALDRMKMRAIAKTIREQHGIRETTIRFIGRSGANLVVGSYDTGDVLELPNSDKSGWARQDVHKTQTISKVQQTNHKLAKITEECESADSLSVFDCFATSPCGIKDTFIGPTQSTSSIDPDTKSVNPATTCIHLSPTDSTVTPLSTPIGVAATPTTPSCSTPVVTIAAQVPSNKSPKSGTVMATASPLSSNPLSTPNGSTVTTANRPASITSPFSLRPSVSTPTPAGSDPSPLSTITPAGFGSSPLSTTNPASSGPIPLSTSPVATSTSQVSNAQSPTSSKSPISATGDPALTNNGQSVFHTSPAQPSRPPSTSSDRLLTSKRRFSASSVVSPASQSTTSSPLSTSSDRQFTGRRRSYPMTDSTSQQSNSTKKSRIARCREQFAKLLQLVLIILSDEVCVDIYQVQAYVQQLPIVQDDPDKRLEPEECREIKSAVDIAQIFSILGKYMNYNNFNLLGSIIGMFGNRRAKNLLHSYIENDPGDCQLYKRFEEDGRKISRIRESFANLVIEIVRILESERVNVKQLAVFVQTAPVSGSNPKRIRKADIQKLREPESVSHIFSIIVSYMDYNSYYLLSCVVRKFGNRRTRRMLHKYKCELFKLQHECAVCDPLDTPSDTDDSDSSSSDEDDDDSYYPGSASTGPTDQARSTQPPSREPTDKNGSSSDSPHQDSTGDSCSGEQVQQHSQSSQEEVESTVELEAEQTVASSVADNESQVTSGASLQLLSRSGSTTLAVNTEQLDNQSKASNESGELFDGSGSTLPATLHTASSSEQLSEVSSTPSNLLHSGSTTPTLASQYDSATSTASQLPLLNRIPQSACSQPIETSSSASSSSIQTVVVKRYFTPWTTGQIHVHTGQKVKIDTSILNTVRTRSRKAPSFVKVFTECGREGLVPLDVLSISSVCSRPSNRKHSSHHLDGVEDSSIPTSESTERSSPCQSQRSEKASTSCQYLKQSSRYSCTTVERYGYRDSRISSSQSSARFSGHSHNEVPPVVQPESTTPNVDSILKRRVTWAPDVGSTASPPLPPPPPHHHHHSRPHSLPVAVKSPTSPVPQPSPEHVDAKPKKSKGRKVLSQFRKIFRKSTITVDETSSYLTLSPVDDMMMLSTQLNSTRTVI